LEGEFHSFQFSGVFALIVDQLRQDLRILAHNIVTTFRLNYVNKLFSTVAEEAINMYENRWAAGALSRTPLGSLQLSPDHQIP